MYCATAGEFEARLLNFGGLLQSIQQKFQTNLWRVRDCRVSEVTRQGSHGDEDKEATRQIKGEGGGIYRIETEIARTESDHTRLNL